MKNRFLKYTLSAIIAFLSVASVSGQNKLKMELGYNISIPTGSFKTDFIEKTSLKGVTGEISYAINPLLSVGFHSGFQSYYQKYPREVYRLSDNQHISAVVINTLDIVPLLLRGTYFPLGGSATAKVQPYITAAAGINMINYSQFLGEFGGSDASAPFAAQAGAGIQVPLGVTKQTRIKVGANYNYVNYDRNEISKLNNIGINAGVVFNMR